jgi:Holliday junction resolvase
MITEERVVDLEAALARFMEQTSVILAAIHEDIAEIRASNARTDRLLLEIQQRADRDRQQADKDRQQAEKDRKDFNKRLAELSDSMGTLIEDMVAPCGFQLAHAIFGTEEAETCAIRIRRKHPVRRGESVELDLVAVGPTKLLAIEVKRRPNAEKIAEYRERLARVPEFFPEWSTKTIIAAVASVYWEASTIAFLNRQKIYGIAVGDDVMEVVNLGQF